MSKKQPEPIEPITITVTVNALLLELRATYTAAVAKLEEERADLYKESSEIRAASNGTNDVTKYLAAKAREAERESDRLLLAGEPEQAQAKREEQERAERAPLELETRLSAISAQCDKIFSEEEAVARRAFAEWHLRLRAELLRDQLDSVTALDKARDGIARWAGEHGLAAQPGGILTSGWEDDLTARDRGPERPLFERLRIWFGGRQR
jgi:hypothetical protein